MDNINVLPLEILERILSYLNFSDRKTVRLVCSYWRQVLHGVQFQRRCRISICRTFNRELPDMEMRVTQSYRNISLNQWSDSDDEDDEQCTNEDITNLKYLFEPCPENNIKKLLFQRFDLEALALYSSFGSSREILEKQLSSMTNLRELELTFCKNRYSLPDESVWVIHHDKLETLKIDVTSTKPFKVVLSRLKKLELLADCSYSIHIIQSHCWQLQDLKIYFQDPKTMDDMMSLSFPVLTNLEVYMFADKDVQLRYARIRNEFIDREKEENFIKSMPKLKSLLIESNLMFYRIQMALTKHGHQLEKLTLASLVLDAAQLLWIEKLPKIKTVILQYIAVPASQARLAKLHMPHLHHLALLYNKSYIGFDNGLIGLKSLKLTVTCERNQTILHQICNKLPNLEQLELFFYCKLITSIRAYVTIIFRIT
ncbi:uncharacterized protein LOC128734045 [Sabethes cyaneus]|uniref:uncharacterized protein LOC128734045 n=1 Tax=Sabethes cyaneus TaxID=53552 RepID=UPI00237DB17C|nr:uncharacterized protein LOC128734045 [Sabethes cyaneus]